MLDASAEQLRDLLVDQAVAALADEAGISKHDPDPEAQRDRARAFGRYEGARAALIAWLTTVGQVAERTAPVVADTIIQSANRHS
jgi:hypothetical protein